MISSGVCEWIHFSVARIALVIFCTVASFFAIQSAAGIERAARILAAEHVERVLLRARVATGSSGP